MRLPKLIKHIYIRHIWTFYFNLLYILYWKKFPYYALRESKILHKIHKILHMYKHICYKIPHFILQLLCVSSFKNLRKIKKGLSAELRVCNSNVAHWVWRSSRQIQTARISRALARELSNACINIFVPGSAGAGVASKGRARECCFLHARRKTAGYSTSNLTA